MNNYPWPKDLSIKQTAVTKIIQYLCLFFLIFQWIFTFYYYQKLPNTIPIHYNFQGEVDGYGSKIFFVITPIIATLIFAGLYFCEKYPKLFNFPVKLNENNAIKQYEIAVSLVRKIQIFVQIMFAYISLSTVEIAIYKKQMLNSGIMIFLTLGIIIPIIYYLIQSFKHK